MSERPVAPKPSPLFEETWVPFQTSDLTGQTVLVLSPHPDDESIGCGGAIALHRRKGDPVKVVFLTDGRRGDETQRYDPQVYIAMRQREARAAGAVLGVTDMEFWNEPDRGLLPDSATLQRLVTLLDNYQPSLIYAPSPLEFHPDHQAAAELTWRAVQAGHIVTEVAFYEVNQPLRVNLLVNIDKVMEQKQHACNLYPSQLAHRSHSDFALGLNRYRSLTVAGSCTYAEGFFRMHSQEISAHSSEEFARRQWAHKIEHQATSPLVSIIIRTQDRLPLLREALASVAQQTYPRLEIVIVNDGGADVGPVIDDFRSSLDIQLCTHNRPSGRAAAANTGLQTARGDLINFLDDDDRLYPHHVERLVLFLQRTGGRLVYT
ncbi:MAG: PIG-L family deacetylase, partial [Candidatus Binatia bacterium]